LIGKVVVMPKPVVNDPQGVTVKQGLSSLGFDELKDVRIGKYIELRLDAESVEAAGERIEQMCRKLLANHVIEDFTYTVHGENPEVPPPNPPRNVEGLQTPPDSSLPLAGRAREGVRPDAKEEAVASGSA
jgi:phosphoribosylformylglycinamidine synthase subunit PurS